MELSANGITPFNARRNAQLRNAVECAKQRALNFRFYPRNGAAVEFERNINRHSLLTPAQLHLEARDRAAKRLSQSSQFFNGDVGLLRSA